MRYQFVGKKIPAVGKTLWEIVGNLKNFGVGRLVIKSAAAEKSEPSFFKIVKVQPLPPKENEFENRNVMVWIEEVYKGKKIEGVRLTKKTNDIAQFRLIPKLEEEKYWKLAEEFAEKNPVTILPRYISCPPLFRELWKANNLRQTKKKEDLTKLNLVLKEDIYNPVQFSDSDEIHPTLSSDLHKLDVPVDVAIKEIVRLQKIVNAHNAQS